MKKVWNWFVIGLSAVFAFWGASYCFIGMEEVLPIQSDEGVFLECWFRLSLVYGNTVPNHYPS